MAREDPPQVAAVKQDEADRDRKAADDALQQLDWAIGYLRGIRKVQIARALAPNRAHIRRDLMQRAEEPLPTQTTDQTQAGETNGDRRSNAGRIPGAATPQRPRGRD